MIGISPSKTFNLVRKIVSSDFTKPDLNLFISYCQSFSKACLINEMNHGRLNLNQSLIGQEQIDDFALDCIADLFARDEQGDLFLLKRYFEPQLDILREHPERVIPVLRKLIASRVHQSLISLFSRVDQGGWKIWRNLSLVAKRHEQLYEFSFLEKNYLYYDEIHELNNAPNGLNPQAKSIPDELLREKLQAGLKKVYGLPQAVAAVLLELRQQKAYQQFLSRGHIYYVLKELLNISYLDVEEIDSLVSLDRGKEVMELDLGPTFQKEDFFTYLHDQIETRYVAKGKINHDTCTAYHEILQMYFSDLLSDGYVDRLPQYLVSTGKTMLEGDAWLMHRGRLEYMIKLGKSHIRDRLEANDFSSENKMQVHS